MEDFGIYGHWEEIDPQGGWSLRWCSGQWGGAVDSGVICWIDDLRCCDGLMTHDVTTNYKNFSFPALSCITPLLLFAPLPLPIALLPTLSPPRLLLPLSLS